ncbi:MAG: nitrilase-related carbon-nitrogen hydrolase, partial [Bryobacteraceae bacterium]
PFGEYVPFIDGIPALRRRVEEYIWNRYKFLPLLRAGTDLTLFPLSSLGRTLRFAVLICYEDVLPDLVTGFARRGADFLLVITNEHFYHPREMDQHLDMAVLRAIETRRPLLRAANTGLTAAIDPTGAITARLERDVEGTLDVVVPLASGISAPHRTVRFFGPACGVVLAGVLAAALWRRAAPG